MTDREFMTREEAADFLRLSLAAFDRLDIVRVRLGQRTVYWINDLREYAIARRSVPHVRAIA